MAQLLLGIAIAMTKRNVWIRRLSQGLFLALWTFLFWQSAHPEHSILPPDLFLLTDPLVALLVTAASRVWVGIFLYSGILIALTLVFGRFFCGWVCPLGTVFDIVGRVWKGIPSKTLKNDGQWRRVKYYLLAALGASAVLGSQQLLWCDPLVLLFRGSAMGLLPQAARTSALLSTFMLVVIIGLCGITHRFWCRYLCPLGAFYAAFGRYSLFRRRLRGCDGCKKFETRECQLGCPMGASPQKQGSPDECIRCMRCETICHRRAPHFALTVPLPARSEHLVSLDRRTFVTGMGAGAALGYSFVHAGSGALQDTPKRIVRPPMVTDEETFLALCVRCGQCVRSCPEGALQPLLLEAGIAGLWSPAVTARTAGCKVDCNNCSQACPTQAIPPFGAHRTEKWALKMGQATFTPHRCVTYEPDAASPCLKCVSVCPNKAIVVDETKNPARPQKVLFDRCVGCGLCESACQRVTMGAPAMELTNHGRGTTVFHVEDPTPRLPGEED
jgi:polyferredoxin